MAGFLTDNSVAIEASFCTLGDAVDAAETAEAAETLDATFCEGLGAITGFSVLELITGDLITGDFITGDPITGSITDFLLFLKVCASLLVWAPVSNCFSLELKFVTPLPLNILKKPEPPLIF